MAYEPGDQQQPPWQQQPQQQPPWQQQPGWQQPPVPGYGPPPGYPQPGGYPPGGWQQPKPRGGLATTSLVLGIIALVLGVIPFLNFGAYPFAVLAVIFGLISISWGKAKAGVVLGVLGLIAAIVWTVVIVNAADDAVNKPHTVVYNVTGSIGKADISYFSTDTSAHDKQQSLDSAPLPFTKTIRVKGDISGFDVTASTHFGDNTASGTLACSISVDGKVVSRDSANGASDVVSCNGTGYDGN